jgi:acyl-CoA synthetase (AMP-forming)/AMP-acid ligase II
MNVANWLERAALLYPDAPALLVGTRVVANYAEFRDRAARMATAMAARYGITPGDRVAIFLPNRIEYLDILYSVWFAGAVVVPINAKLHAREVAWMVENCQAKMLIAGSKASDGLSDILRECGATLIDADDAAFRVLYDAEPMGKPSRRASDDIAWLFYTSGTTGKPNGVMITHGNLQAMTLTYFVDVDAVTHDDVSLYAAPISHGAGLYNFMFVMKGARHVVPESGSFDAPEIVAVARELGNLCLFAAPTMVRRMVANARMSGYRGEGLKTIVYGGGPMYVSDILEAVDLLGPRFAQIYGQGESPMTITALSKERVCDRTHPHWRERLGSVGIPQSSVEVMVADENGGELPRGQIGEVLVSGAPVMKGYWRNPEATAEAIRDGWLWTGDMGMMDEDGFLTLCDRSKDMIVSGGTNIYPREVEEVLLTHPAVAQISVVGKPDSEWGETVVAFVVAEDGKSVDEAALDAFCVDQIARFKRPKEYIWLTDLPKNAYGKVLKTELRKLLGA